jgi:hypothetical protein
VIPLSQRWYLFGLRIHRSEAQSICDVASVGAKKSKHPTHASYLGITDFSTNATRTAYASLRRTHL